MTSNLTARKMCDENLDESLVMSYLFQQFDWLNGYRKCDQSRKSRDKLGSPREVDGYVD
jgi:hypothetical protein